MCLKFKIKSKRNIISSGRSTKREIYSFSVESFLFSNSKLLKYEKINRNVVIIANVANVPSSQRLLSVVFIPFNDMIQITHNLLGAQRRRRGLPGVCVSWFASFAKRVASTDQLAPCWHQPILCELCDCSARPLLLPAVAAALLVYFSSKTTPHSIKSPSGFRCSQPDFYQLTSKFLTEVTSWSLE